MVDRIFDPILSAKLVDGVDGAIEHISKYGSNHTDSIVTDNPETAERFLNEVDSAIVLHTASTQYADGGESGWVRNGISTDACTPEVLWEQSNHLF